MLLKISLLARNYIRDIIYVIKASYVRCHGNWKTWHNQTTFAVTVFTSYKNHKGRMDNTLSMKLITCEVFTTKLIKNWLCLEKPGSQNCYWKIFARSDVTFNQISKHVLKLWNYIPMKLHFTDSSSGWIFCTFYNIDDQQGQPCNC